ncbi:MAG: class I SAM-dependent methyltransferase [Acidobacteriota bacterium]|nr:class I SAM-dependent methyltransferase [Acidobacteriota bacterium]
MNVFEEQAFAARAALLDQLDRDGVESPLRAQLEAIDARLFARLRQEIRDGLRGDALLRTIRSFVPAAQTAGARYDLLDSFLTELLLHRRLPAETKQREAEMVFYQRTPSRFVLELCASAPLTPNDMFYDIGSGLGEVAILVRLLTDATVKGVEFEPAYCDYAHALAAELNLSGITFLNADARDADFSAGTVFFLYTPFTGKLLQRVLDKLRGRKGALFTFGPCTVEIAQSGWARPVTPAPLSDDRLVQWTL